MSSPSTLTPEQVAAAELRASKEGLVRRIVGQVDVLFNVVTDGLPGETISSRSERDALKGDLAAKLIVHVLDIFQANHGLRAMAGDTQRAEAVIAAEHAAGEPQVVKSIIIDNRGT